jgi:hypothetical protein
MGHNLANFCRERAKWCRAASEGAPTETLRRYWLEAEARWRQAEAQWLGRFAAWESSQAEFKEINSEFSSQETATPRPAALPNDMAPRAITFERFNKWFDTVRADIAMRHSQPSREAPAMWRKQAEACRKAADCSEDVEVREYWRKAEAYWLSLADKAKSPNGAN